MAIAKEVYALTKQFPADERYGLVSQINRSAISCPSNITEGCGRNSKNEFKHFLSITLGSSYELETQLMLAESFGYLSKESLDKLLMAINKNQKMTAKLIESLSKGPDTKYLLPTTN